MNNNNNNNNEKNISISLGKAVGILVTAMLVSAGGSVWGTIASINSDHFVTIANAKDIQEIRQNYVLKEVDDIRWKTNDSAHSDINNKLDRILTILDTKK